MITLDDILNLCNISDRDEIFTEIKNWSELEVRTALAILALTCNKNRQIENEIRKSKIQDIITE